MIKVVFLFLLVLLPAVEANVSIDQYGAVADRSDLAAQLANANAIVKAVQAAANIPDGLVLIPNATYHLLPVLLENLQRVVILNTGTLIASDLVDSWQKDGKQYRSLLTFSNCSNTTLTGGRIDGRGYQWWVLTIYDPKKKLGSQGNRPHLIKLIECTDFLVQDVHLKNSPQFHIFILDCLNLRIGNIRISVNRTQQHQILQKHNINWLNRFGLVMFPFNTDGIDPQGTNIHIYNITSQNYNDIVVIKPLSRKGRLSQCSQNILVENVTSVWGSGMAVGTVPPSADYDCVRNVTFRNIHMRHPFKGVYIKTYPSATGAAIIENVHFENMTILRPLYWPIYIGPHKDGPGCLHVSKCKPEPKVTIRNISFKGVTIKEAGLYPYMILCDKQNPCTSISFQNVHTDYWLRGGKSGRCFNAKIQQSNTVPELSCVDS